jgi:pimeloyl-ACP methyl ester carboxylesterase
MATAGPTRPTILDPAGVSLPRDVLAAMSAATPDLGSARRATVLSAGTPWATYAWGDPTAPPFVLVHGVTSNAESFWRIAPAIAAAGRRVIAVDLPGHGRTGHWRDRHRFEETAVDLAGFLRTADLHEHDVAVLGHSWGGMVVAALPKAGYRPERLLLLDPPALPAAMLELMTRDPLERPCDDLETARATIRSANPGWTDGDVEAKALGLTQFEPACALAVLLENGDWDGGLAALADPAARDVPVWLIRGDPAAGGMIPDAAVPAFTERAGPTHVITIRGAPHSPQRTAPEATTLAILRALGIA